MDGSYAGMKMGKDILGMGEDDLNEMQRDIDQAPEIAKSRLMRLLLLFVFVCLSVFAD